MPKKPGARKYFLGCEQFPVHFEGDGVRIYTNPRNKVFIEDMGTETTIRLNRDPRGGLVFTTSERVEPVRVSNIIGWRIRR